jgi:hypothetical protein
MLHYLQAVGLFGVYLVIPTYFGFLLLKKVEISIQFKLSLSSVFGLAVLQFLSVWFFTLGFKGDNFWSFGINITVIIFVTALIFFSLYKFRACLGRGSTVKIHRLIRNSSTTWVLLIGVSFIGFLFASRYLVVGDLGWDSNAYHLPIAQELVLNSARHWSPTIGLGYYTYFAPYGTESLFAFSKIISGSNLGFLVPNLFAAIILTMLIFGICRKFNISNYLSFLIGLGTFLIPSVIGQLDKAYVDLYTGTMWIGAFCLLILIVTQNRPQSSNSNVFILFFFLSGSAIACKSFQMIQITPLIFSGLVIYFSRQRMSNLTGRAGFVRPITIIVLGLLVLVASGIAPYFRNYADFGNPVFPIQNFIFSKGNIQYSSFRGMFDHFMPHSFHIGPTWFDSIVIWPMLGSLAAGLSILHLRYDPSRHDLSLFSYDTTSGGIGLFFAVLFLYCSACLLILLLQRFKRPDLLLSAIRSSWGYNPYFLRLILLFFVTILSYVSTPGGWWPRYSLGPMIACTVLFVSLFLVKIDFKFPQFTFLLASSILIFSLYGSWNYTNYELSHFKNNEAITKNLNIGLPQSFLQKCTRIYVLEPRPTFNTLTIDGNCREIVHLDEAKLPTMLSNGKNDGAWIWLDPKVFKCSKSQDCKKKVISIAPQGMRISIFPIRAWFDTNFDYGGYLLGLSLKP